MKHPLATNKASDGALSPRSAAPSGRLGFPSSNRRLLLLGSLRWAGAARQPYAASSDANTAIELLREDVTSSVPVWFGWQIGLKNWICDGLVVFEAPWVLYSVLGAVGPRAPAAPAPPLEIDGSRLWSSRGQGTSLHGLLRFHGIRQVELDKLLKLNQKKQKTCGRIRRVRQCLREDSLFDQQMQIRFDEKNKSNSKQILILDKTGPCDFGGIRTPDLCCSFIAGKALSSLVSPDWNLKPSPRLLFCKG